MDRLYIFLLFHPPEVGTHLIRQTGKTIQQLRIIPEHFIIFCFFIDDVMVNFAPAFFKQGSALYFNIIAFVFDGVVQGSIDAGGNDVYFLSVVNFAVTGTLISFGTFCNVEMVWILIEII